MKSTKIQAAFAALLDTFEPITGQPTDEDLIRLKSSILQQVMSIPFDLELGEHNLMGLVLSDSKYKDHHDGTSFPTYLTRPGAYPTVASDATVGNCAKKRSGTKSW